MTAEHPTAKLRKFSGGNLVKRIGTTATGKKKII